jgi:predicted CXXCH cytochrome family protein
MLRPRFLLTAALLLLIAASVAGVVATGADDRTKPRRLDPAAWGGDHVGKPTPAYVTGDECLFCHRKIGPTWNDNPHQLTIRPATPDDPAIAALGELAKGKEAVTETRHLMGSKRITRFLKRSKDYGKLELLSTTFHPGEATRGRDRKTGELKHSESLDWDKTTFGDRCAGCHATAVSVKTRAFSATSLDCFSCHGDVDLKHTKDVNRVLLSSKSRDPRKVVSICGQCHLRGGKSKSTGQPYPNTFVAGDNLFRDFQVDFSGAAIRAQSTIDRHIYLNARDVAILDRTKTTCLTCHDVHGQSSEKHQKLDDSAICASCHVPGSDNSELREAVLRRNRLQSRSRVCDY